MAVIGPLDMGHQRLDSQPGLDGVILYACAMAQPVGTASVERERKATLVDLSLLLSWEFELMQVETPQPCLHARWHSVIQHNLVIRSMNDLH